MTCIEDKTTCNLCLVFRSQIGFGDDKGRESLKVAMEKARRRMEEGTPDGSPGSSRGCSPFPDLYTGPHLLDAIKNLDLSPNHSPAESPMPPRGWDPKAAKATKDGTCVCVCLLIYKLHHKAISYCLSLVWLNAYY